MMARKKRKHAEFAEDAVNAAENRSAPLPETQDTNAPMVTSDGASNESTPAPADGNASKGPNRDRTWEVTLSKKERKKQKKEAQQALKDLMGPSLNFPNKIANPLRVKDLQALVLYVLSDGVAPTWIALKNGKKIDQVVVLMVPGMETAFLSRLTSALSEGAQQDDTAEYTKSPDISAVSVDAPQVDSKSHGGTTQTEHHQQKALPSSPLSECIIPIKAPGDNKTGKVHSSVQNMLISPEVKGAGSYKGADNVFAPVRMPVAELVHCADELLEAQYPVHPSIFTNPKDAGLEKSRREGSGQCTAAGWVDTRVSSSAPVSAQESVDANDLSSGMQVYALDCEMVVTEDDVFSLARISVLSWHGKVILDKLVKPSLPIKDYCTPYSGITEKLLEGVKNTLNDIQKELLELFTQSSILLGHSLESDFNAMKLTHPFVVDTSILYPHPRGLPLRSSLKFLANKYLKREIQKGGEHGHDSVEDARAVLDLIRLKCEKGPKWGTMDANGESIFARLTRSGCKTAIVEYGAPEKGLGRLASVLVGCRNDDEVTEGVMRMVKGDDVKMNFIFGRLRAMDRVGERDRSSKIHTATAVDTNGENESQIREGEKDVDDVVASTVARLGRIHAGLPPSTLFMVFSGPGDMKEVARLQNMQKQYRKEFKVKKWDELSVKWTDNELQALIKATEEARKGCALVCIK
jgi:RNA exonuclease 1